MGGEEATGSRWWSLPSRAQGVFDMARRYLLVVAVCWSLVVLGGCGGGIEGVRLDAGDAITPQISLTAALAVPVATAPTAGSSTNVNRLNKLQTDAGRPDTVAELKTELSFWVNAAKAKPNDSAAQLGLALLTGACASQNAAHAVGESILGTTSVKQIADLGVSPQLRPQRLMSDALAALTNARIPPSRITAAADGPATTAADLKLYRQAIQDCLLVPLDNAQQRLLAVADTAALTAKLFTVTNDGTAYAFYSADFRALGATIGLVRCALLMATSVDPDYGTYDWSLDMVQRDKNKDSKLTVAEYAPAAPFGAITPTTWTDAGTVLRDAVAELGQALQDMTDKPNELLQRALDGLDDPTQFAVNLADASTMLSGPVNVTVYTEAASSTHAAALSDETEAIQTVPVDLRELWDTPPASLRNLLPPLYLSPDWGSYTSGGSTLFYFERTRCGAENAVYRVTKAASPYPSKTGTIPTGVAPHAVAIGAGGGFPGIDGTFNWNWKQFTGKWGATSVTASSPYVELGTICKWSELPDPTLSGVFPSPTRIKTLVYGNYGRVILRYGSIVVGDTESDPYYSSAVARKP